MSTDRFMKLCLASRSPRRKELLHQMGVEFDVLPADIDESQRVNESPSDYVERMSLQKAQAITESPEYHQKYPVLASDTAVVVDDIVLGKPVDENDGIRMLSLLSGRAHKVITGVAMIYQQRSSYKENITQVSFRELSPQDMLHYWRSGEGQDKAGCYGIQGKAASFIDNISGSFSGVMGLPIFETAQLLQEFGVVYWRTQEV